MKAEADWNYTAPSQRTTEPLEESGRGKEGVSLEPSEGSKPCPHLGFRLPASRTGREYITVVLSHQDCGVCYDSPKKPIQTLK